jgi:hypothetical protein
MLAHSTGLTRSLDVAIAPSRCDGGTAGAFFTVSTVAMRSLDNSYEIAQRSKQGQPVITASVCSEFP